ncbi:potassium channel family protein [Spirochaetota bacterium]
MKILEKIRNFYKHRTLRYIFRNLTSNIAFKLLIIGVLILTIFTFTIYHIEKNYVFHKEVNGQKVEDSDRSSNIRKIGDSVWWAFVTSTTVGYGDFFPKSPGGRFVGILLMFFGVALTGLVTGNIASFLVERQLKEGRGLKQLKLKNHFIICGWKRDMPEILSDIMDKNKSFLPSEIVLINMASPDEIENLKSEKKFSQVNFLLGDDIDERVLNRANVKQAKKVLVLADRLIQGSTQEVDSRTVMTVITVKSLSKTIYVAAELLDSKFERYLMSADCDEIILSSEYNRSLIANASAGSGISHIVSELLNVKADVTINTFDIPKKYVGKNFKELFNYYLEKDQSILIGILENTGNFYTRKREAIRDAQKTPDISKLVDSLREVKTLIANNPIINPKPDYVVKDYSRSILINGRS